MIAHVVSSPCSPSPPTAMSENSAMSRTTQATLQSVSNADKELMATTTSCSGQLFECSRCHQRFGRADHLSRHVRTRESPPGIFVQDLCPAFPGVARFLRAQSLRYTEIPSYVIIIFSHLDTLEKPHRCTFCAKSFARSCVGQALPWTLLICISDLLKRHVCFHLEKLSEAGNSLIKWSGIGSRVSRACKECSASKLKCSEEKPCHWCVSKGILCKSASNRHYEHATTDNAATAAVGNEEGEASNLPETKTIPQLRTFARCHSLPNFVLSSSQQQSINLCPGTQAESNVSISCHGWRSQG